MSVVKKEKICTSETFEDKGGHQKRVYYRIGEIITFKDDKTGGIYQRAKLSNNPTQQLFIFPEERRGNGN